VIVIAQMSNYKEEQRDEMEALESIYPDTFQGTSTVGSEFLPHGRFVT